MARIPVYEQTTTPSGLIQGGKLTSAYVASPVGRAISEVAQVGQQFVKAFDQQDALVAEEKLTQLREEQSRLAMDERDGFLNKRGKDAIDKDANGNTLQEQYMGKFTESKARISAGMTENQLIKFNQKSRLLDLDFKQQILKHTINEADRYADDVFKNTITAEQAVLGRDYQNPVTFKVSLDRVMQSVNAYADRKGLSDDQRSNLISEQTGKLHASVLTGALAERNVGFAERYIKSVEGQLDADDKLKFNHVLTQEKNRIKAESKDFAEGTIYKMVLDGASDIEIMDTQAFKALEPKAKIEMMGSFNRARDVKAEYTPEIYAKFYELSTSPEQLKTMTQEQIFAMTPELGRTMVGQLLKKKSDITSSPDAVNIDNNQLKQIAAEYGVKNKDKLGKVEHDISILLDAEQGRLGRKLSYTEKEDFIRKAMVKIPVETKGMLWGTNVKDVPLYELNKIKETGNIKIPAADRKIIVDSLVKNGVTEPTEAQILNGYILLKKK
jgi:hypothetical protein